MRSKDKKIQNKLKYTKIPRLRLLPNIQKICHDLVIIATNSKKIFNFKKLLKSNNIKI